MEPTLTSFLAQAPLKEFYTIVAQRSADLTDGGKLEDAIRLAPFLRKFSTTYINYYGLRRLPPLAGDPQFSNRLEAFLTQLADCVLKNGLETAVAWLLDQEITPGKYFFACRPVMKSYPDISRGLNALNELFRHLGEVSPSLYDRILHYIASILSPTVDAEYEQSAKETLDCLIGFNARTEGVASAKFQELTRRIEGLNRDIDSQMMSNNSYVSIVQQISEINRALKTVFKKRFEFVFIDNPSDLERFWSGLKEIGYVGGDRLLNGDFYQHRRALEKWLREHFEHKAQDLLDQLEAVQQTPELPHLAREPIPDAIQIYALNLLGNLGLQNDAAIRLVLSFYSRFVGKMIRDAALQTLRKNAKPVQSFFYSGLKTEPDYQQQLLIAEKHDAIYGAIQATALVVTFGEPFRPELERLDTIVGSEGVQLSGFLKSAFMRLQAQNDNRSGSGPQALSLQHFRHINDRLLAFKAFAEAASTGVFYHLLRLWGISYLVSWSLADYEAEKRLFRFIFAAAGEPSTAVIVGDAGAPLNDVIRLLTREPDAKQLIEKLMTFLLNSKISFDFPLFQSLFRVVAQRAAQLQGGIRIRDGFSEQRGYSAGATDAENPAMMVADPHIFHPIVVFLISVLNMKAINIPKDAFIETDISFYLNSLAGRQQAPKLGYQMFLAHKLIAGIPYIVDFASHHEGVIRKTIADLDESYQRQNVLIHYHRIKIHRAPSRLDLDFCLEILEGLSGKDLDTVLHNLIRLMQGIGDEAIPDMRNYFAVYANKLQTLGRHLKQLKAHYPDRPWVEIAEAPDFKPSVLNLPDIDEESLKDVFALVRLANALSGYWTRRITPEFIDAVFSEETQAIFQQADIEQRLKLIRSKRLEYQSVIDRFDSKLEPYQHIFLKRHVIQCDWNFDFFGFWPYYSERKFEVYNRDRKLALFERLTLEHWQTELTQEPLFGDAITEDILERLRIRIDCLVQIMIHLVDEGLSPSKFFLDTIDVLKYDPLSLSQLHDVLGILSYRELAHIDAFIANTFGHFPERITQALGRENLDYDLDKLSADDDALLYPLVQETVLGNLVAEAHPIPLLERHLRYLMGITGVLSKMNPSHPVFPDGSRPYRALSPVDHGYKAYALITLAQDGFNVPALETIPVHFFRENPALLQPENLADLADALIEPILRLEAVTGKHFAFNPDRLSADQLEKIQAARQRYGFDPTQAPQLLLSARSGSYRSMPGILGTVINIGYGDFAGLTLPPKAMRDRLSVYRMFLSTFGNVVYGIREAEFSRIVEEHKRLAVGSDGQHPRWEELDDTHILGIVGEFRRLIEDTLRSAADLQIATPDWSDPLALLALSTIGVWRSWDSPEAVELRAFLDISDDWRTPVTLMEMKMADRNDRSFSAILFSGDPQGKNDHPHGDVLFGRPGEDIAAGLASRGVPLESLETDDPELYMQIVDLLEQIKVNKGNINVDVEMVGEYDYDTGKMDLYVVQERQMPLGLKTESDDYRLTPTTDEPIARGSGVNGGVQYGVFLDGVDCDYYTLMEKVAVVRSRLGEKDAFHGPAIFLLMKYVTPAEALKMNILGVDGIITPRIGKSSHASISAKRDGKVFICEAEIESGRNGWEINGRPIRLGDCEDPDLFTVVAAPRSVSPYSGNIYQGIMPMTRVQPKSGR
jgi:hypothetical protein